MTEMTGPRPGFAMTPAWLLYQAPHPHEILVYVHLGLLNAATARELADATGLTYSALSRALRALQTRRAVEPSEPGTDPGQPTVYRPVFDRPEPRP